MTRTAATIVVYSCDECATQTRGLPRETRLHSMLPKDWDAERRPGSGRWWYRCPSCAELARRATRPEEVR